MSKKSGSSVIASLALVATPFTGLPLHSAMAAERTHTDEHFSFVANGSMDEVFPLFGAKAERSWAPEWDPHFLSPTPAADREGMVFQIAHESGRATWVNVAFDRPTGRVQYVYVLPDVVATLITLDVRPLGSTTSVSVRYERTALDPAADAIVQQMAADDRVSGPEWAEQINRFLGRKKE